MKNIVLIAIVLAIINVNNARSDETTAAFSARFDSSSCPRKIRKNSEYFSNFVKIRQDHGSISIQFRGNYGHSSPIGHALKGRTLVGRGLLKVKGFAVRLSRPSPFQVNGLRCKIFMTATADKSLSDAGFSEDGPLILIPISGRVDFRCPKVKCSSYYYNGVVDLDPA